MDFGRAKSYEQKLKISRIAVVFVNNYIDISKKIFPVPALAGIRPEI